jgi:hypothetical protein
VSSEPSPEITAPPKPSSHLELRGAIAVTSASLQSLWDIATEFAKEAGHDPSAVTRSLSVWQARPKSDRYNTVDEVISLRNERTSRISSIAFRAKGPDFKIQIMIDSEGLGHGVGFSFEGEADDTEAISRLAARIESEHRNIRLWYSPFRSTFDRLMNCAARVPVWAWTAVIIGGLSLSVALAMYANHVHRVRVDAWIRSGQEILEQADRTDAEPDPESKKLLESIRESVKHPPEIHSVWWPLLVAIPSCAVGALIARAEYFFPRVVFEIGEGKSRHDQLRTLRAFVFGTVVISGLLIPRLRSALGW